MSTASAFVLGDPDIVLGMPSMARKICRRQPPAKRARKIPPPTRWIEGTAPVVRLRVLDEAARLKSREMRVGQKSKSTTDRLTFEERAELALLEWELTSEGATFGPPKTYGECVDDGPCPRVSCRYNLYLDVKDGAVKYNFPGKEIDELKNTCALRVADEGAISLEQIGVEMNLTVERNRQIEHDALRHAAEHPAFVEIASLFMNRKQLARKSRP